MAARTIYLEVVPKGNIPWSFFYIGLVVLDSLLLLLAWFEVYPFSAVPDLVWGAVVLATFALPAFIQTYQSRRMRLGDEGRHVGLFAFRHLRRQPGQIYPGSRWGARAP